MKKTLSELWYKIKLKLGLAPDWMDPIYAPPAFENIQPHVYRDRYTVETVEGKREIESPKCCTFCGGGRKNPIHV